MREDLTTSTASTSVEPAVLDHIVDDGTSSNATQVPTGAEMTAWMGAVRSVRPITAFDTFVPAAIFLAARLAVAVTAKAVTWARPEASVMSLLTSWDGGWYLAIAEKGYPDHILPELGGSGNRWAFYPAYPALIRGVHGVTGVSYAAAAILASLLVGTAAVIAIWYLINTQFGRDTALFVVSFVSFFPTAYVLGMAYTESLFLLASALCLIGLGRRMWVLAGLAASLGYLTRQHGLVLVGLVGVCALWAVYQDRKARPLVAVPLALLGPVVLAWFQQSHTGTTRAALEAQKLWDQNFVWFTTAFRSLWRVTTDRGEWSAAAEVMAASALVFAVITVVLAADYVRCNPRTVPVEWLFYSAGMILVSLSPKWATSILRYQMTLFPLVAIAFHRCPRWITSTMVLVCAVFMGTLAFGAFLGALSFQTAPYAP